MKKFVVAVILLAVLILTSIQVKSQQYIANYSVAKEEVLRSIPEEFINKARTELIIAYQHTSHGTHVVRGIYGLPDYKDGDDVLFGSSDSRLEGKLDFRDYALTTSSPAGIDASDLSIDETAFIQTTRNYLDKPQYANVNVIMWSWCNIAGHDVAGNYLPGMDSLIAEYGPGGTKIGSGEGQKELPVTFIFMTGHANKNANVGELNSKSQAALITEHCNTHGYYCLDYYSIDTHDMDDNYWEDTGENGDSDAYGGNFYEDWQNSHVLGEHYFENKMLPGGEVNFGQHNTQHITSNRKGYAMWWILARIAGWEGGQSYIVDQYESKQILVYPNPGNGRFFIDNVASGVDEIQVFRLDGTEIYSASLLNPEPLISIDLSNYAPGIYGLRLLKDKKTTENGKIILSH